MGIIEATAGLIEQRSHKTIADHYKDGTNFLFSAGIQTPLVKAGELSVQVDMADYLGISDDGKAGYVTVYPGLSAGLSVGISPVHLGAVEYKFAGGREDLNAGVDVKGFAESSIVAGYGVQLDERGEPLDLFDTDINVSIAEVSATSVLELPRSEVQGYFVGLDYAASGLGNISDKLLDIGPALFYAAGAVESIATDIAINIVDKFMDIKQSIATGEPIMFTPGPEVAVNDGATDTESTQIRPGAPPTGSAPGVEASIGGIKEVEPNNIESQVHDLGPLSPQAPIVLSGQLNSVDDTEDWFYIHPTVSGNITSKYSDDRGEEDVLTKYHDSSEKVPYSVILEEDDDGIFNYQSQLTLEPSAPPPSNEKPAPTPENEQDLGGNPPTGSAPEPGSGPEPVDVALKDLPPPPPVPAPPSAPPPSAEESAPAPGNFQILPGAPPTGSAPEPGSGPEPVDVALKDLPPPPPVPAPPSAPPPSAEDSAPKPPASDTVQDLGGEKPSGDATPEEEKLAFSDLPPPPDIPPPPPPSFSPGSAPEPDTSSEAPSSDTVQDLGGSEPTAPDIGLSSAPDDILLA